MPVYVYRNLRTGEKFEVEQRITEPALTEHPESGDPVKRLVQPVGIAFKGSGFYVTDSRSGSSKEAGKSNGQSDSGSTEKPTASGEGKSDSKAESKSGKESSSAKESKSTAAEKGSSTKSDS